MVHFVLLESWEVVVRGGVVVVGEESMSAIALDSPDRHSSSPELSSPPSGTSPPHHRTSINNKGGLSRLTESIQISSATATDDGASKPSKAAKDPSAPKRPRIKKEPDSKTTTNVATTINGGDQPIKKPRAKRGTGVRALKKKADEEAKRVEEAAARLALGQSGFVPLPQTTANHPAPPLSQNGNREGIPTFQQNHQQHLSLQPRTSSGQNYDPIRSATVAPRPITPINNISTAMKPTANRSPSISSLIDPPDAMRPHNPYVHQPKKDYEHRQSSPLPLSNPPVPSQNGSINAAAAASSSSPMEIVQEPPVKQSIISASKKPTPAASKGPSPGAHSPKPSTKKDATPLPAPGSGLLSGTMFGGPSTLDAPEAENSTPTVILNVPLTGEHQYVNFTRLAEEKYGFHALHPRLAAQRDRLARVAAAGAALEKAKKPGAPGVEADDMSEDLSNEEGDDSNVEMGGIDNRSVAPDGRSGEDTGEAPKKRKRIMREDMYDIDDGFIDDTEQAWEEKAAVSQDGFFVYLGPLVQEGEDTKVERSEVTPKRGRGGGRGSRGGVGSRGGRASAARTTDKDSKDGNDPPKRRRRTREEMERDKAEELARKEKKLMAKQAAGTATLPSQPTPIQMQMAQVPV
ncbi:uncharacterized protein KY384_005935 [Bacidia gigantensis]|uniref:uncharacterized protein n=1 Tax=Bacidia gigantensis TaxID=2732470 RepID=UPI001D056621|nr:uncharacterized protein KY384_005935 [Bacidia gigantensis]KAG8529299.1 hypothetical protein KY384_005935 [Bacidia gigantensis]